MESLSVDPITGLPVGQAPTGVAVLGRISQLTKEHDCNGRKISRADAYITVAEELFDFWIFALNRSGDGYERCQNICFLIFG